MADDEFPRLDPPDPIPPSTPPPLVPDYYRDFLDVIKAIEVNTKQLTTLIPKEMQAQTQQLLDVYSKAGQPSRGIPASTGARAGQRSGSSTLDASDEQAYRAELLDEARRSEPRRPRRISSSRIADGTESQVEGGSRSAGQETTQTGTPLSAGWRGRVQLEGLGNVLSMPRFPGAEPNTADFLNYMSTVAANAAYKRQTKNDKASQQAQQQVLKSYAADDNNGFEYSNGKLSYGGIDASLDSLPNEVQDAYHQAGQVQDTRVGKISDFFASAESGYAQGRYLRGILSKITNPVGGLRQVGYETGAQGGSPGPLGIRSPFDSAVGAGFGQLTSRMGFALSNDVTPGQASTIYDNLYGQGWLQGPQTQDMRNAGGQIMRSNPYIGSMPQTYAMMDQATRQGATSLDQFVQIMSQVPSAALAAHTSIAQTMSDMDALGQQSKQTGGTYGAGLQNAQAWQNITGMPAGVMGQLMQNSFVQGQTFLGTGLMPFEQGLATPGQHTQGILSSLNLLSGIVPKPANLSSQIGGSGFYNNVGGQDQKEALIAQMLGVDKTTVHTMLANRKGWQAGANIYDESNAFAGQVTGDVQANSKKGNQAAYNTLAGTGPGTYGQLHKDMSSALDAQGHKVFEDWDYYNRYKKDVGLDRGQAGALGVPYFPNEKALHKRAQETAIHNVTTAGNKDIMSYEEDLMHKAHKGGSARGRTHRAANDAQSQAIAAQIQRLNEGKMPTNLSGDVMHKVANDRRLALQKYQNENTQKFGSSGSNPSGPRVTIELGPAAKKVLNLSSPQAQQKAQNGAGSVNVNMQAYAPGTYTVPPMPDLGTASTITNPTGTYDYGSQYDTTSSGGNG